MVPSNAAVGAAAPDDELVGGEREPADPGRCCRGGGVYARMPAPALMLERSVRRFGCCLFGRSDEGESLAGLQAGTKPARAEQVLARVKPSLGLDAVMEIPVPVRAQLELAAVGQHAVRRCAGEGGNTAAVLLALDRKLPPPACL